MLTAVNTKTNRKHTPLRYYWDLFVDAFTQKGRSKQTIRNVNDALNLVERHLTILTIEECNNPEVLDVKLLELQKQRRFTAVTFNSYLKNISTYIRWLKSRGYVNENCVTGISRAKEDQKEQVTLSTEQVQRVVGQLNTRRQKKIERCRNTFFIDLLRFTGARPCELLQLEVKDIFTEGSLLKLVIRGRKQKGKPRHYNLPSFIRDSYDNYFRCRNDLKRMESNLFISCSRKTGWTYAGVRKLFQRMSGEVGFKITSYSFRRNVATTLINAGVPPQQAMEYLGHKRITTTMMYVRRTTALTDAGANVMSQYM